MKHMSSLQQQPNKQTDSRAGNQNQYPAQQPISQQLVDHLWNAGVQNTYFQGLIQNLQGQEYVFQPQATSGAGYSYQTAPISSSGYTNTLYGTQSGNSYYPLSTNMPYSEVQNAPMSQPPYHLKINVGGNSSNQFPDWMGDEQDIDNQLPQHIHATTSSIDEIDENSPTSAKKPRLSAAAQERRRERNKLLARKTRQKKKVETELLRDQLVSLMHENNKLKEILRTKQQQQQQQQQGMNASRITHNVPSSLRVSVAQLLQGDVELPENMQVMINQLIKDEQTNAEDNLVARQRSYIIVNPNAPDAPIVYVSDGFLRLTGYSKQEIIGRNCRFLQGEDTDYEEVRIMQNALAREEDFSVVLLNYTKQKRAFWNMIEIAHVRDKTNHIKFIVGLQNECPPNAMRVRLARQRYEYHQQQAQYAAAIELAHSLKHIMQGTKIPTTATNKHSTSNNSNNTAHTTNPSSASSGSSMMSTMTKNTFGNGTPPSSNNHIGNMPDHHGGTTSLLTSDNLRLLRMNENSATAHHSSHAHPASNHQAHIVHPPHHHSNNNNNNDNHQDSSNNSGMSSSLEETNNHTPLNDEERRLLARHLCTSTSTSSSMSVTNHLENMSAAVVITSVTKTSRRGSTKTNTTQTTTDSIISLVEDEMSRKNSPDNTITTSTSNSPKSSMIEEGSDELVGEDHDL